MPEQIEAFQDYEVPGVGTVIAHVGDSYHARTADGRVIGWAAENGTPSEASAAADYAWAENNPAARIAAFVEAAKVAVQAMLDARARASGYDGILSAASYAGEPTGVFAAEGEAFAAWRSQVWAACYAALGAHDPADALPEMGAFPATLPAYVPPAP